MGIIHWIQQDGAGIVWAVLIFALMIFIHEFGHFCVAKLTGVKVLEFALGFGYRIFGKKAGDTEYGIRVLPLGGYVRMLGEGDDGDPNDPGNFQNKTIGQRTAVVAAGPVMNYILALFIFLLLGVFFGVNTYLCQVAAVKPDTPAAAAGLKAGDEILAINGKSYAGGYDSMNIVDQVVKQIQDSAGKPLHLQINRGGKIITLTATPTLDKETNVGVLGFYPEGEILFKRASLGEAVSNSLSSTWFFTKFPFVQIGKIFQGKVKASMLAKGTAGPLGIVDSIVKSYNHGRDNGEGLQYILFFAAILNVMIGLFNLFPIPALDGSRIFIMQLGALFGKELDPKLEEKIHLVGFAFLLLIMVLVTFQDLRRIITNGFG